MLSGGSGSREKGEGLFLSSCKKVKGLFLTTPCALLYLCQLDNEHIHVSYPGPFANNVAVPREGIGALLLVDRHRHRVDAMLCGKELKHLKAERRRFARNDKDQYRDLKKYRHKK